ncbi:D-lactate ferricytochrome c oxidoreductase [Lambiella insularis]|nr:D-lactate ferricytochrome c oxidoreductase [Lambiella insularis]
MPLNDLSKPLYDLSEKNLIGAKEELIAPLGKDLVSDDLGTHIAHSSTEWLPVPRGDLDRPSLVVYPRSTTDVSEIAKICHKRRIPMIGFSGGTSLEGTLAALNNEICLDFRAMNKVIALQQDDMDVIVEPGLGYEELNQPLASEGLFFCQIPAQAPRLEA